MPFTFAEVVYFLCMLTSLCCAVLLLRKFFARRTQLLLWSGVCFLTISLNNGLLFLDLVVFREIDFSMIRTIILFTGMAMLNYGLIRDSV